MTDMCTCCAGCWCPCFTVPQVYVTATGKLAMFGGLALLMWILYAAYMGVYYWYYTSVTYVGVLGAVGALFGLGTLLLIVVTYLLCNARNAIKKRDGIMEDDCSTCCMSCCP